MSRVTFFFARQNPANWLTFAVRIDDFACVERAIFSPTCRQSINNFKPLWERKKGRLHVHICSVNVSYCFEWAKKHESTWKIVGSVTSLWTLVFVGRSVGLGWLASLPCTYRITCFFSVSLPICLMVFKVTNTEIVFYPKGRFPLLLSFYLVN